MPQIKSWDGLAGQYEDVDTVAVAALFSERCPTDCQAESLLQSLLAEWKGFQSVLRNMQHSSL